MRKWLFNPFIYIAGAGALLMGWVFMTVTAVVGYYSLTHFDGPIDMHVGRAAPIQFYFIEQLVSWLCLTAAFFAAGKLFSHSRIRFIDVAGTMALARWPALVSAVIGFGIDIPSELNSLEKLTAAITPATILFALLSCVMLIWMIALMYNAFVVSCHIKSSKATVVFIGGLIVAEIISKLILSQVYKFSF
jgi:hypothetical protein